MRGLLADPSIANAVAANNLGMGFSGSGFLMIYFVGVLTSFEKQGLLSQSNLKLAGASGGALSSLSVCAGVPASELKDTAFNLVKSCRGNNGCSGTLDKRVRDTLYNVLPSDAYSRCSGPQTIALSRLTVPGPDTALLVSSYSSNSDLVGAAAGSAFIPLHSGPSGVTVTEYRRDYVYDGGFTTALPCPGGVQYCVRISAEPYGRPAGANAPLYALLAAATAVTTGLGQVATGTLNFAANVFNAVTGADVPSIQDQAQQVQQASNGAVAIMPPPTAVLGSGGRIDIAPGKYESLQVSPEEWSSYALDPPDDARLQYMFDLGTRDADAWWRDSGASVGPAPSSPSESTGGTSG